MSQERKTFNGIVLLYSETGTEGGYWALQDENYMHLPDSTEICAHCRYHRSYVEQHHTNLPIRVSQTQSLLEVLEDKSRTLCPEGQHVWALLYPDGKWSHEGLHILRDGDELTIYNQEDPRKIIYNGTIKLREYPPFTQTAGGLWIHADQEGIDRETWASWFRRRQPGILITSHFRA